MGSYISYIYMIIGVLSMSLCVCVCVCVCVVCACVRATFSTKALAD